jgi:pimeloyl-ACP methyl ester carboxylesterase
VASHDRARLLADAEEVGEPVAGRRRGGVLGTCSGIRWAHRWPSRQAGAKWHGDRLSQLRVPTLVMHGSGDPLLRPAAARRTAQAISGARLVILPRVGHYLPPEVYPQVGGEVRALADRAGLVPSQTGAA